MNTLFKTRFSSSGKPSQIKWNIIWALLLSPGTHCNIQYHVIWTYNTDRCCIGYHAQGCHVIGPFSVQTFVFFVFQNSKHSQASFVKCNIVFTMNAGLTCQWLQCKLTLIAAMPQKPKGFASSTSVPPTGTTPMSTTAACTTLTFILARLRSWSVTNAFWVNRMHWCCNVYKWKAG